MAETIETNTNEVGQIMRDKCAEGQTSGTFTVGNPTPEPPPEGTEAVTLVYK